MKRTAGWMAAAAAWFGLLATARGAPPEAVRVLFDFENDTDIASIAGQAEGVTFEISQDNGVTSGRRCAKVTFEKGAGYRQFHFTGPFLQGWDKYDYFAMDVTVTGEDRTDMSLEFWDGLTKGYPTRCSLQHTVVPGRQTVVIPINRCKRNNKEGREWDELEPQDKIQMNALRVAKILLVSPKDHDLVWWVDNVRLLKEEALGLKMSLELPAGAVAYQFGKAAGMNGFTTVPAASGFDGTRGFAKKEDLTDTGKKWPDPLTGNGVYSPAGKPYTFEMALPDGDYLIWLAAGQILRNDIPGRRLLLKVGDKVLYDDTPSQAELNGERYLYRFMRTPYSERPNALWLDFVSRMYPAHTAAVKVSGGRLAIEAAGYLLSAVIALPAGERAAFESMTRAIQEERMRVFAAQQPPFNPKPPAKEAGDGAAVCFIPDGHRGIGPGDGPTKAERQRKEFDLAAAPGQNLIFRVAVTPFEDAGTCSVGISDLKGPSPIPASAVRLYFQDFRLRGIDVRESALIPTNAAPLEKGVTRCFWAWARVPPATAAGDYSATVTVRPGQGPARTLPVRLKVQPIRLEEILPYAFGMWYGVQRPADNSQTRRVVGEQFAFMREIGMTGVEVGGPNMDGVHDPFLIDLARAAGMGREPNQHSIASALGMGRQLGRVRLGLGARIDQRPGCEFENQQFKNLFVDSARKYAAFLKQCGLPIAVQTVDEPRENPNPWNRNLDQTNLYGDYLKEAGVFPTYTTPMGDGNAGKDYTSLVDHHDIISTHPGKYSEKLMTQTLSKGKTLWLYNAGMDRLSWGFYNWRVQSKGRWEWHFCWSDGGGTGGYLNEEWYNPFTSHNGFAPRAPYATFPGAMLFQSAFLTCAEGITDAAYLTTLEKAMAAAKAGNTKADAVAKAEAFLVGLRKDIPFLPDVQGFASEADGAAVGQGIQAPAAERCEEWRRQIAALLAALR